MIALMFSTNCSLLFLSATETFLPNAEMLCFWKHHKSWSYLKRLKNVTSNGILPFPTVGFNSRLVNNRLAGERPHIGIHKRKKPANTHVIDLLIFIPWIEILVCLVPWTLYSDAAQLPTCVPNGFQHFVATNTLATKKLHTKAHGSCIWKNYLFKCSHSWYMRRNQARSPIQSILPICQVTRAISRYDRREIHKNIVQCSHRISPVFGTCYKS